MSSYTDGLHDLDIISGAPSVKLLLPQLDDENINSLIKEPSISCFRVNHIRLQGNFLMSNLCLMIKDYESILKVYNIDVPYLKNIYIFFDNKDNPHYKIEKININKLKGCKQINDYG